MEIVLLIVGLALGGFGGYKVAYWSINKKMLEENAFLREQNQRLKDESAYWANQATNNIQFHQSIIHHHNINLANTLGAVVQLLQGVKNSSESNLSNEERNKVEQIIQQAKSLGGFQG